MYSQYCVHVLGLGRIVKWLFHCSSNICFILHYNIAVIVMHLFLALGAFGFGGELLLPRECVALVRGDQVNETMLDQRDALVLPPN